MRNSGYDDGDLPTHYGFKVSSKLDALARQHATLASLSPKELENRRKKRFAIAAGRPGDQEVQATIDSLDERGAWVEDGKLRYHGGSDDTRRVIESTTFIRNLNLLSRYLDTRSAR